MEQVLTQQLTARAVRLTLLLHEDGSIARKVVERAMAGLHGTAEAQRKRLYYGGAAKRSKTHFPLPALLQMLVFAESSPFEQYHEQSGEVAAETLRIRYVKHLIWSAARRNSFHVAVAVCRLLFSYTTTEAMAIYDSILEEEDFLKEDYYYRARKRVLMNECERRFPTLVRIQGARGEERFESDPSHEAWLGPVRTALEACTPWDTHCHGGLPPQGSELARLHALIHPPCFEALVARAGLPPPRERMSVPSFDSENATLAAARIRTITAGETGAMVSVSPPG